MLRHDKTGGPLTDIRGCIGDNGWLHASQRLQPANSRLFCFPYAGGGAQVFSTWRSGLPPAIELVAVSLPGREAHFRSPPFREWDTLIDALAQQLEPHLDLPYAFFGHSLGARVGFELTHRLCRIGLSPPDLLIVSACRGPGVALRDEPMHALTTEGLQVRLRAMGGVDEEVLNSAPLMTMLEATLRADLKLAEIWRGTPKPVNCPIVALSGLDDHVDPAEDMAPWRHFTTAEFRHEHLPGGHFFLSECEAETLTVVRASLQRHLSRSEIAAQSAFPEMSIPSLFEQRTLEAPDAVALLHRGKRVTYGMLNQAADDFALRLRRDGVKPGDIVVVTMARSPELVAALLAILKVGAAYLPVDPDWPRARLETIVDEAGAAYLLRTDSQSAFAISNLAERSVGEEIWHPGQGALSAAAGRSRIAPDDLAYVNFTSGSSGKPKGVMITHRGVLSLLFWPNYTHLSPKSVILQLSSPSFDAMTFELWGPLLHGGVSVLFDGAFPHLDMLRRTIKDGGVTTLFLTTALFNVIIDEAPEVLETLDAVLTGGEAHSISHIQKARRLLPQVSLSSMYGPTEATTFATHYPIDQLDQAAQSVPIGKATNNREVIVAKDDLSLCAKGEPGQICIAGPGLARGYIGRPDLTRQKFVTVQNQGQPPKRYYKTGDLGCYHETGNIEFLGRSDFQIKLNGFRIELEEIERVLIEHPGIKRAAVVVAGSGEARSLQAFVIASHGRPEDWSRYLRKSLPAYMIPSAIRTIEKFPLNTNGKVDRRKLLALLDQPAPSSIR